MIYDKTLVILWSFDHAYVHKAQNHYALFCDFSVQILKVN